MEVTTTVRLTTNRIWALREKPKVFPKEGPTRACNPRYRTGVDFIAEKNFNLDKYTCVYREQNCNNYCVGRSQICMSLDRPKYRSSLAIRGLIGRCDHGHRRTEWLEYSISCAIDFPTGPEEIPMSDDMSLNAVSDQAAFFAPQNHLDTVVFVHGIRGHFSNTWGKFPELLASDEDLPKLDIYMWGYPTGILCAPAYDVKTLGDLLISDLAVRMQQGNALHMVGHSMGGLVILQGLVSEMIAGRAQRHPASSVSFISLFASPVSGSTAAAVVKQTIGSLWRFGAIVNKQIRSLARGRCVDGLLTEVIHRIYQPSCEDSSARPIPIRMVMAKRDKAVSDTDRLRASARYRRHPPLIFDYGHSSIKEPRDHNDERYKALSCDIQDELAGRFHQICVDLESHDVHVRNQAEMAFGLRYEHIFRRRLEDRGIAITKNEALYRSYLRVIVKDCRSNACPPFYAADRALTILVEQGHVKP